MRRRKVKMVEAGLALVSLWWGILLSLPENTFDSTVYDTMHLMFEENVWALQSLLISLILSIGIATDNKVTRGVGLLLSTGFWTFVAVSLWLGDHVTTGSSYIVWAVMAATLYIHLIKVGDG